MSRPRRSAAALSALTLVVLAPALAAADIAGRWRFAPSFFDGPQIVTITRSGATYAFAATIAGVPDPVTFTGSVGDDGIARFTAFEQLPTPHCPPNLPTLVELRVHRDRVLYGGTVRCTLPTNPDDIVDVAYATRCSCFDGNTSSGDGCDAACQIEPCWTCTGNPSLCMPSADGAACDDRSDCTSGTTCSAGVCGGGAAVPACVDLTGRWNATLTLEDSEPAFATWDVTQIDGIVSMRTVPAAAVPAWVGTLDVVTRDLFLRGGVYDPVCRVSGVLEAPLDAVAASNGLSFTGTGIFVGGSPTRCMGVGFSVTASKCGGGTVDPGETCDDGNRTPGDGCDADCAVEPCFACTGAPSTCTPLSSGSACDDGDTCTTDDVCTAGACVGSALPVGAACDDGDPCTLTDLCTASGCVGGTPSVGAACDDGNACTSDDACTPTGCAGAAVDCGGCQTCNPLAGCIAAPRNDCAASLVPTKSLLSIRRGTTAAKNALTWKWNAGDEVLASELGTPTTTSDVAFCVFDESDFLPSLLFRAIAPAGETCGTKPCWKSGASSIGYKDGKATGDGLRSIQVKAGAAGRSKATLKGKGAGLASRLFGLPDPPLDLPLRAQLQIEGGACLESSHDAAGVRRNDAARFDGRGTP